MVTVALQLLGGTALAAEGGGMLLSLSLSLLVHFCSEDMVTGSFLHENVARRQ